MVAPLRRLFVTLLGVAVCTPVLAGVVCVKNSDGSWTCSGDGNFDPEHDPYVVTNVVGVCTNCVSISPEECQQLKSHILDVTDEAWDSAWSLRDTLLQSQSILDDVISEGDSFWPVQNYKPGSHNYNKEPEAPQAEYVLNASAVSTTSETIFRVGNNSIANYYNEGVRPALSFVRDNLSSMESDLDNVLGSVDHLRNFVDENVDCQACTASFGGPSSSTNTPSGGGSSTCPDCPCKEQMEALQNLLKDDFLPRIKKIDANVAQLTNLITIAKNQLEVTKQGFHNTTNLLNRLDDYVLDDFSNKVVQLNLDVNFIASNLAAKVRGLFINDQYSNATFYVSVDSQKIFDIENLDSQLFQQKGSVKEFDWAEYKDMTWFTRIEYLIAKLTGLYDETYDNSNDVKAARAKLDKMNEDVPQKLSSTSNSLQQLEGGLSDVGSAFGSLFASFSFFGAGRATFGGVEIVGGDLSGFFGESPSLHIYAFDNDESMIEMADGLLKYVHYFFQIIYLALFSYVLFVCVVFLYKKIAFVVAWLAKLYSSVFGG